MFSVYKLYLKTIRGPIASSALSATLFRFFNMGLGFIIVSLLGHKLGATGFGYFALGASIATFLAAISQSGLEIFIIRYTTKYNSEKAWGELNGIRRYALFVALLGSVLIALFILAALTWNDFSINNQLLRVSLYGALIAPVIGLNTIATALLRGLMRLRRAYFPQLVLVQLVHFLCVVVLIKSNALTPENTLLSLALAWSIATGLSWYWVQGSWPNSCASKSTKLRIDEWSKTSLLLLIGGAVGIMFGRIETIALAQVSTPLQIGLFAFAFRFAQLATFPGFAIASGLDPVIADLRAKNDYQTLSRRVVLATRLSFLGAGLIAISITVGSDFIFPLIAPEFKSAVPLVFILSLGYTLQAAAGRPFVIMSMFGHEKSAAMICATFAVIGIGVVVFLSAKFGAMGAALATSAVFSTTSAVLSFSLWRHTGVRCDIFATMNTPTHQVAVSEN